MNHAQKSAWLCLLAGFSSMVLIIAIGYALLTGFSSNSVMLMKCSVIPLIISFFIFIFVYPKMKKSNEPESDERDKQISKNALRICLLSLCLLIYISDAVIMFLTGLDGWIPSSALPVIHFGIGYTAFTIYYATVLILYGKDNKQTEGGAA